MKVYGQCVATTMVFEEISNTIIPTVNNVFIYHKFYSRNPSHSRTIHTYTYTQKKDVDTHTETYTTARWRENHERAKGTTVGKRRTSATDARRTDRRRRHRRARKKTARPRPAAAPPLFRLQPFFPTLQSAPNQSFRWTMITSTFRLTFWLFPPLNQTFYRTDLSSSRSIL